MADNVQWIKLKVGMFDGNSFKKIKRAMIGGVSYRDKLTSVWFELMDLAGKSNANGYLIDNNEIPYHTFEDIAIMIDRETEEVELCMQFFIKERMVEIIDNIYCLSNFEKYQCVEGLEKIREQKRIAQAKWRERKSQGLIGINVDSTVDSTSNLPSISNSKSKSNKFIKPTLEEVSSYCKERNNGIDAEAFIAFYESKGWLIGKTPMKSWKSAIITWEKSRKQNQPQAQQNYATHSYKKEEMNVFDNIDNIEI